MDVERDNSGEDSLDNDLMLQAIQLNEFADSPDERERVEPSLESLKQLVAHGSVIDVNSANMSNLIDGVRLLLRKIDSLEKEVGEADRHAGKAIRENTTLKEDARRRDEWLDDAKQTWWNGDFRVRYRTFDEIWTQCLENKAIVTDISQALRANDDGCVYFTPKSSDLSEFPFPRDLAKRILDAVAKTKLFESH